MLTTKKIVSAINEKFGVDVLMFKGDGYYYFEGNCLDVSKTTSVCVNTLNSLTLEGWIFEFSQLLNVE